MDHGFFNDLALYYGDVPVCKVSKHRTGHDQRTLGYGFHTLSMVQWEFQDPKMELLCHILSGYSLTWAWTTDLRYVRYLQSIGSRNAHGYTVLYHDLYPHIDRRCTSKIIEDTFEIFDNLKWSDFDSDILWSNLWVPLAILNMATMWGLLDVSWFITLSNYG